MTKKIAVLLLLLSSLFAINLLAQEQPETTQEEPKKESIIQRVERWYDDHMNYATITLLMTVESSFIPFPSEIVIPPAAYVASNPDNPMNVPLVIFFGTLGSLLGALINYFLAMWLGRPIVYKFADSKLGRLCLLSSEKIQKAEDYFNERGKVSTFVGRLIPGIRQLISLPAGLARMNIFSFMLYTVLGAGIWNVVLALLGYFAHGQQDLINEFSHELSYIILGILGLAILYFVIRYFVKRKNKKK